MRLWAALIATAALAAAGSAQAASVDIRDAVARVTVIPENRTDVRVEIIATHPGLPLQVRTVGDRTIIEGGLDRRVRSCGGKGEDARVRVADLGDVTYREMPQVVIRTPRDARVEADGAVFGTVGRAARLDLAAAGCGDWTVANVEGELRLSQAGSGDIRAGGAGGARLRLAGSGDISLGTIAGPLSADIAGSGDVSAASVGGDLDAKIAGSGDVTVRGGRGGKVTASIAGSGDVTFEGAVDSVTARIAGSGNVRVREVRGEVSRSVLGSGRVEIGS
jgi:hypothetical protein